MNIRRRLRPVAPFLLLLAAACGDAGGDATGSGGSVGTAGSGVGTTAGTGAATGGSGSAGTPTVVTLAGSGQALGGGDQGGLFPPNGSVPIMKEMGGSGGSGGGGAETIPGDGHVASSTLGGSIQGKATFTQMGHDVIVVVNLTGGCATGNHMFRIYDGDSCDSPSTEGNPWVPRGVGLGPDTGIACSNGKGTLNYTRKGDDKTKNLTVASHDTETDLSTHVVIVSDEKDPNSRAACGNFFF